MRRASTALLSGVLACGLVACGSSDDAGGGSGDGSDGLDRGLRIGILYEIAGESSYAISDFANGAQMAIDEINDAGGVGGHPVEMKRLPVSLDPQKAVSDYLAMVDWEPDIIIGFPSSAIEAVVPQITRNQIPVLTNVQEEEIGFGGKFGSEYLWMLPPVGSSYPPHATEFFADELGASDIAVLGTDETFGRGSSEQTVDKLDELGLDPQSQQLVSTSATDFTPEVLQMRGADATTAWIYPNQLGLLAQQLQQNGISIPIIDQSSMELAINYGTASAADYDGGLYAILPCSIGGAEPGSDLAAFRDQYQDQFDAVPFSGAAVVFDGVHIAAQAAEIAGSVEAADLNEALAEVEYEGICSTYQADPAHIFGHSVVIVEYQPDGTATVVQEYTNPELEQGKE
jgi:branched-chain amino acid transport system substrate-binding protein